MPPNKAERCGTPYGAAGRLLVLLAVASLATGCAHTWTPGQVPPVPMEAVGKLGTGMSVHLINDQPLNAPHHFAGGGGSHHYANYHEWTEFFINYWGAELTKRGVAVGSQSPNKMNVRLDNFGIAPGLFTISTTMAIHLSSPDNTWKNDLLETDSSGLSFGRAVASLIHHTVEKLMRDPEVMGRMKPPAGGK